MNGIEPIRMQSSYSGFGLFCYLSHALHQFTELTGRTASVIYLPRWRRREWIQAVDRIPTTEKRSETQKTNDCFFNGVPVHWSNHHHIELA